MVRAAEIAAEPDRGVVMEPLPVIHRPAGADDIPYETFDEPAARLFRGYQTQEYRGGARGMQ